MIDRLFIVGALGAGAYWAYQNGHLDGLLDRFAPDLARDTSDLFQTGGGPTTALLPREAATISKEEQWLRDHWADVSPWARRNLLWTSSMMWQESRGNPNATSGDDARGLMQVIPGTQEWVYNTGYKRYPATPASLWKPRENIYFGTHFLQMLSKWGGKTRSKEWMARAYNAGPAGQRNDGTWPAETVDYLARIETQFAKLQNMKEAA